MMVEDERSDVKMAAALRFFGTVTASVSHELNNVNSTIEQLAGLLEDHLAQLAQGRPVDGERLRGVHDRILRQTRRASDIIAGLNAFAHRADEAETRFEMNALLANLMALSERLAARHRVELALTASGQDSWLVGNPFLLTQLIFGCIQVFWEAADAGTVVRVTVTGTADEVTVEVSGESSSGPEQSVRQNESLTRLAAGMGASLRAAAEEGRRIVAVTLPRSPA